MGWVNYETLEFSSPQYFHLLNLSSMTHLTCFKLLIQFDRLNVDEKCEKKEIKVLQNILFSFFCYTRRKKKLLLFISFPLRKIGQNTLKGSLFSLQFSVE